FCSLPLPQRTGLPVHVNAFFDLDASRQRVTADPGTSGSAAVRTAWNRLLLEHAVAPAYARLLSDLAPVANGDSYDSYYALWPGASVDDAFSSVRRSVYALSSSSAVVRCRAGEGHALLPFGNARHLGSDAHPAFEPLALDGVPLPEPAVPSWVVE